MGDLPQTAIDILPFSAEPISQWKTNVDIRLFAEALYPPPFNPPSTRELDPDFEREIQEQARIFTKNLMESPNASASIDFYHDHRFGQVAKYTLALKCCILSLLEDGRFYSLAHILEAESDLDCSLLLASHFYYKQSTLMLRSVLEEVFLPIHFCDSVSDFEAWKANSYRTPNLRGKDGLIKKLHKKNIIDEPLAIQTANLYAHLSGYVHGSQNILIHRNIHLGQRHAVKFNEEVFSAWCRLFCECIETCIRLLKINNDQWSTIRSLKFEALAKAGKTFCNQCHNEDAFDRWLLSSRYIYVKQEEEGNSTTIIHNVKNLAFYRYICHRCRNTIIVNAAQTPLSIVICFSIDNLSPEGKVKDITYLIRSTEDPYCEWYNVQTKSGDILPQFLVPLTDQETRE